MHGGGFHRVPADWRFPRCGVQDLWRQWWIGDTVRQVSPLRSLEHVDVNHLDNLPLADDEMHGRTGGYGARRRLSKQTLCDMRFLMNWMTERVEAAGHREINTTIPRWIACFCRLPIYSRMALETVRRGGRASCIHQVFINLELRVGDFPAEKAIRQSTPLEDQSSLETTKRHTTTVKSSMVHAEALVVAVKAVRTKTKTARDAVKATVGEKEAKLKCLEFEKENRSNGQLAIDKFTLPKAPLALARAYDDISCGEMVLIQPDLSPGKCRHGGLGHVIDFEGIGPSRTFTVRYHQSSLMGATTESGISYNDISRAPDGAWEITSSTRKRSVPTPCILDQPPPSKKGKTMTLVERLVDARSRGMGKGWRAKQLGVFNPNRQVARGIEHDFLFMADYQFLVGWMAASDSGKTNTKGQNRRKDGKFTGSGAKTSKAISLSYLHCAWGVGKNYALRLKEKYPNGISGSAPSTPQSAKKESTKGSVIDSYEAAFRFFTAKELFLQTRMHQMRKDDDHLAFEGGAAARERNNEYRRLATVAWTALDDETKAYWESKSRSHLALQPHIRDRIIGCFRSNPSKSYRQVEEEINGWCSAATIHKWFSSQDGYCLYVQRPLPLLSREQMAKHVKFSKFVVHDFWGLPPGTKVLLIHYDEKWFYGFVGRANAKMAEKVGLDKVQAFLHHKSHINKVMCVAFTGYAFEGNMENGGDGLKLGFYRCNAAKIAKKQVRQSRRDERGNLRYDGEIKRKKGDCYMVDCVVTGSDQGTSDNPKFSLKALFQEPMFPLVESLLKENYKGFVPVIQGDNAGPHIDEEYINYVKGYCEKKGWVWAPQAPQMPHANNLDLAIFPAMSRCSGSITFIYRSSPMSNPTTEKDDNSNMEEDLVEETERNDNEQGVTAAQTSDEVQLSQQQQQHFVNHVFEGKNSQTEREEVLLDLQTMIDASVTFKAIRLALKMAASGRRSLSDKELDGFSRAILNDFEQDDSTIRPVSFYH
ncbi:hypothetical protein IV203_020156 [Nitzschia inconspicua]|uniref:Uncharacterized protein n=1 Tax=Nitzschia inconspicua TaxID=303405 RepID=A0A9K3M280_9STRA|nr:hypothetical protein IV203_020346 [Nitzschia inconspicua]KAG7371586.1 hypothetical protein IV203_020156 [Nitzschia inconspicua]